MIGITETIARSMIKIRWEALNEDYRAELINDALRFQQTLASAGYIIVHKTTQPSVTGTDSAGGSSP